MDIEHQILELKQDINRLTQMVAILVRANEPKPSRFITRGEIIEEHGRTFYETMRLHLRPIRKVGRNGLVKFERRDYETYLQGRHRI